VYLHICVAWRTVVLAIHVSWITRCHERPHVGKVKKNMSLSPRRKLSLRYPLIASPIGFAESTAPRRLKITRWYAAGVSLVDVLSDAPPLWIPTAKAKAIAGIALALRLAHRLHRGLKASNTLFDAGRRIQLADFSPIRLETGEVEPVSGEGWSPVADICPLRLSFLRSQSAILMLSPELHRQFPRLFPR
jgi:hypothetical protein